MTRGCYGDGWCVMTHHSNGRIRVVDRASTKAQAMVIARKERTENPKTKVTVVKAVSGYRKGKRNP